MDIALTALFTVVSGVFVYALSEFLKETFYDPYREYKIIKAKVATALVLYANIYTDPFRPDAQHRDLPPTHEKASDELRLLAAEVRGYNESVPFRTRQKYIPKYGDLFDVSAQLIGLSNSLTWSEDILRYNSDRENRIKELLGIGMM